LDEKIGLREIKYFSKIQTTEIKSIVRDKGCNVIATTKSEDIRMK
jgi:hypothetical protein